jgi:hypothetical protein
MEQVNPLRAMQFPHSSNDVSKQKHACCGKSDASWQREISKPLGRWHGIARTESRAIKRLRRKHRVLYSRFRQPI